MIIDTNKAWDSLYMRLYDEQLLAPATGQTKSISLITKMKWAATIAILCICGTIGIYIASYAKPEHLLSIQNNDMANVLVSTLEDGSIVYLKSGAILTYPEKFATDKRVVSVQGEVLFDIRSNYECPFMIETEPALVEVLGTEFSIKSIGKESFELSVQHGVVKVVLKTNNMPVMVEAGEIVRLESNQLYKTWANDVHQFTQYTEKMHFKDDYLKNIAHVINKLSDKAIVFADSTLSDRKMTVTFFNNSPDDMVELLCLAMGLKYTNQGDTIVIEKR